MSSAPSDPRVALVNAAPLRPERDLVLYWMIAARRTRSSHALDRAIAHARALGKPLLVLEPLRCGYAWASDRMHAFVMAGMRDNHARFTAAGVAHYPYVERAPGEGAGLLAALAARACVVVTDDFPCFFLPKMVAAAAARLDVRLEQVDGNGLLPMRLPGRVFPTAYAFRRYLQAVLPQHLGGGPCPDPLARLGGTRGALPPLAPLPAELTRRWSPELPDLATLPIDHTVAAVGHGGSEAAHRRLARFLDAILPGYADSRNTLDADATSGLSPYLHFGHLGAHEAFAAIARREAWSPEALRSTSKGSKDGWWRMSPAAEGFLDQLVTWRELGFNNCAHRDDHDRYDSLPQWARATLAKHAGDRRPVLYTPAQLEAAATHDPLWNAAQTQLVRDGTIANYVRMLWGKKILEWSDTPQRALDTLIHLNNKYAHDGRDPNSYTNLLWILGKHDRPWGPERDIYGTVRYMSSDNTARKIPTREYLTRYASPRTPAGSPAAARSSARSAPR